MTPRARPLLHEVLDGEAVVWQAEHQALHRLDARATLVWQALDGRTSVQALADDLATAFGADPLVVAGDVRGLVELLVQRGLVDLGDGAPGDDGGAPPH